VNPYLPALAGLMGYPGRFLVVILLSDPLILFSRIIRGKSNLTIEWIQPFRFVKSFDCLTMPTEIFKTSAHFILCPRKVGGNNHYPGKYFYGFRVISTA
jgi:hypothetical protein